MSGHRTEADYIAQIATLADENTALRIAISGALAALCQHGTFPADIAAANGFLRAAIASCEAAPAVDDSKGG